ncbi:hypothetical protein CALVIDRAFT_601110, partial [Calocera viscosa TUFC12733]
HQAGIAFLHAFLLPLSPSTSHSSFHNRPTSYTALPVPSNRGPGSGSYANRHSRARVATACGHPQTLYRRSPGVSRASGAHHPPAHA